MSLATIPVSPAVTATLPNPTGQVRILNCDFDPITLAETVERVFDNVRANRRGWVCTVNVAILMMMRQRSSLQQFVDRAALVVADGQPLVWFAPLFGTRLPVRVAGVDLVDALCGRAVREQVGVYLLGASANVVHTVAVRLRSAHPGLIVHAADGYFDADKVPERVAAIRASNAKILIVGMGVPRQEQFIEEQWEQLGVTVAIGVGGSFDVLAGVRRRAPVWVQQIGMEWLYRLAQEPRRLFRRYLVTNAQFLALVSQAALIDEPQKNDSASGAKRSKNEVAVLSVDPGFLGATRSAGAK